MPHNTLDIISDDLLAEGFGEAWPLRQAAGPSVFRACQVVLLCGWHAHCYAILPSMISVHMQFFCKCCSSVARVHVSRSTTGRRPIH